MTQSTSRALRFSKHSRFTIGDIKTKGKGKQLALFVGAYKGHSKNIRGAFSLAKPTSQVTRNMASAILNGRWNKK